MPLQDGRRRLDDAQWPRQVDGHDLVPDIECEIVEVGERDRLIIGGVVNENVETSEAPGHFTDQPLNSPAIGDIAGESRGVDLIARCQLARDSLRLVSALCAHDSNVRTLFRQGVTDALPETAVATCDQCNRTFEIHPLPPASGPAALFAAAPTFAVVCYLGWKRGKHVLNLVGSHSTEG
jgi:hypothetical protein